MVEKVRLAYQFFFCIPDIIFRIKCFGKKLWNTSYVFLHFEYPPIEALELYKSGPHILLKDSGTQQIIVLFKLKYFSYLKKYMDRNLQLVCSQPQVTLTPS